MLRIDSEWFLFYSEVIEKSQRNLITWNATLEKPRVIGIIPSRTIQLSKEIHFQIFEIKY